MGKLILASADWDINFEGVWKLGSFSSEKKKKLTMLNAWALRAVKIMIKNSFSFSLKILSLKFYHILKIQKSVLMLT